jgi:hypothetical protein
MWDSHPRSLSLEMPSPWGFYLFQGSEYYSTQNMLENKPCEADSTRQASQCKPSTREGVVLSSLSLSLSLSLRAIFRYTICSFYLYINNLILSNFRSNFQMVLNVGDIIMGNSCMAKYLSWEPFQDLRYILQPQQWVIFVSRSQIGAQHKAIVEL